MAHLCPKLWQKFEDGNGDPLVGGKVYTYAAGTDAPLATFTDQSGFTPNTNPVILNGNGEADIWIGPESYKFVVTDADDVVIRTIDSVTHLGNGSVTEETIADGAVTEDKIADGVITPQKMAPKDIRRQEISIDPITATTPEEVAGTLVITVQAQPVMVGLIGLDDATVPAVLKVKGGNGSHVGILEIWRDASRISSQKFGFSRVESSGPLAEFSTPGSYSWVAPFTGFFRFTACAGGGSGGASNSTSSGGGGGGGGGEYSDEDLYVEEGETYDIEVASGGVHPGSYLDGVKGGDTVVSKGGIELARWIGGAGGIRGTDNVGPGGAGGSGFFNGGTGGGGGAGSSPQGSAGSNGVRSRSPKGSPGGVATPSTPSAGTGGGGGAGGGSLGYGANGPANDGSGSSDPGYGGGGHGARGAASVITAGGSGGNGYLAIFDSGAFPGGESTAYVPVSSFNIVDKDVTPGTHNYTVRIGVEESGAVVEAEGIVLLQAFEL